MASIKKIAQEKGYEYEKNYLYGEVNNYLFTGRQVIDLLNSQNNCKLVYFPLTGLTQQDAIQLLDYLKENKKDLKVREYEILNQVLILRLAEGLKGFSVEQFDYLTENLVQYFKTHHIAEEATCVYCQAGDVNAFMKIDKIKFHAHDACIRKAQADIEKTKEDLKVADKNYTKGMIGAIIGALVGAIPWIILELFWGYAAVLSLLIGYGAYFGYKKFGGVVTKTTKYLMLIPLLIAVLVSNLISLSLIASANNETITSIFSIEEARSDILSNLLIGIIFVLLGYISVFRTVKSDEYNTVIE